MRSAKVIPISDDIHYADYAEFVHSEDGPVEKFMKQDIGEKWQLRAVYMAASLFVVMYVIPAIWRAFR